MENRRPIDRAQLLLVALLPTMLISGTEQPVGGPVLIAQVMTISQESEDAMQSPNADPLIPDGPSQMDLINEADEREGIRFDIKASDIRDWRSKVRSAYPPAPIDLEAGPTITGSKKVKEFCGKNVSRPDLVQREQQLAETQAMLLEEMERLERIQGEVSSRYRELRSARRAASTLQISAEQNCEGWGPGILSSVKFAGQEGDLPADAAGLAAQQERVQQLVSIMKSMKPKAAARILQGWESELAVMALLKLPSRVGSKIVAELPPEVAGELTMKLAPPAIDQDGTGAGY